MALSAIALIIAQASTAVATPQEPRPVAVSATASVRVLRAQRFDASSPEEVAEKNGTAVIVSRDAQGTVWFEFT